MSFERLSAEDTSTKTVLARCAGRSPLHEIEIVVYEDVHRRPDELQGLARYMADPTDGIVLVLTASSTRRDDRTRWLAETETTRAQKRVLHVDCGDTTPEQLVKLCVSRGVPSPEAEEVIERVQGSVSHILAVLNVWCTLQSPPAGTFMQLCGPRAADADFFAQYSVMPTASDESVCRQMRLRLNQIATLSLHTHDHLSAVEFAAKAEVEVFLVPLLGNLSRTAPASKWVERLAEVTRAHAFAEANMPGCREYARLAAVVQ